MDKKIYIESGILEDYVLGLTSNAENKEVEKKLLQYPALKIELYQIEDALATYAKSKVMSIPVGLSTQILQSIDGLETKPSSNLDIK